MTIAHPDSRETALGKRRNRVVLIMGVIVGAVLIAFRTGALTVPGAKDGTQSTQTGAQASLAGKQMAANRRWASATCTNVLDWENQIRRDAASLSFGFDALPRVEDAIAATTRMSNELDQLGLPPGAQTAEARAGIDQLRSDIESRVHNIQGAAGSVASGNLAAIGALLSSFGSDAVVGTQIANELRHVVSVDLGLSLVETSACRQLIGVRI